METVPEKPSDNDCCGSGCTPCVFDVYERMLSDGARTVTASSTRLRYDLLCPVKYKPYELIALTSLNKSTVVYSIVPISDDLGGSLPYRPGQHLIVVDVKSDGFKRAFGTSNRSCISRAYTPISASDDVRRCSIQFFAKLYENGRMSAFLRDLRPGDVIYLRGPFGNFKHKLNSKYIMICAGTGIAPMYSIVKTVLENERDETLIRLCWACAKLEDVIFRDEVSEFRKFWNFKATIYLSNETDAAVEVSAKYGEDIRPQKISPDVVEEIVSENRDYKILICGSEKFNEDVNAYAKRCGCEDVFVF